MSDKEKDYFVPEQLDDNDFEKEKIEEKKQRKENKISKAKVKNIILIVLAICLIAFGVYWYVTPHEKKATAPEQAAKDFCAYLNSGNWEKVNELMDFKGYYTLGAILQNESEYTKFDTAYKNIDETDSSYSSYLETLELLTNIDKETLNSVAKLQIKLNNIQSCNKIQGTDTLYRLIVNFDYIIDGDSQTATGVLFISNASGEYKMVFGEWMQEVVNYYQSIYMLQSNYGY